MGICKSQIDQISRKRNNLESDAFDLETANQKFEAYISKDIILDFLGKKYNLNDPVFKSIREDELKILTSFYSSKKDDFRNNMGSYLQKNQNFNFINMLTKQIITNEGGRKIFEDKIKVEIRDIYNNKQESKINNLTIMILGKAGVGKSCLINNILFKGKEVAKEGDYDYTTKKRHIYENEKVPYLRLVDTRGIEISDKYDIQHVGVTAKDFIKEQMFKNNINEFVHCIWYCVTGSKFEQKEKDLVNNLIITAGSNEIPLIIVLTKSIDAKQTKSMKNHFLKDNYRDVIDIIAKLVKVKDGIYIPAYGLDKLIEKTLQKCKEASNMEMKYFMIRKFKDEIKKNLFAENSTNKKLIKIKMMQDIYKNGISGQNFENYIYKIYDYHLIYFLESRELSSASKSLIKQCEFNRHKDNFIFHCKEYENQFIKKELPFFANKFLDIQATKEKEKRYSVDIVNKRNFNDFINTTEKFLIDNFDVYSYKFYIYFVINNIIGKLSTSFEQELNLIVEDLMTKYEIENALSDCFYRKYSDFEERVRKDPTFHQLGKNNNDLPNFEEYNLEDFISSKNNYQINQKNKNEGF